MDQTLTELRIQVPTAEGGSFAAHLVEPRGSDGRALVLLHTMFGIDERFRGFCREYAAQGYTVIAPNLFWRFSDAVEMDHSPEGYKTGYEYVERLDLARCVEDIAASIHALRERDRRVTKVGLIGYCMGEIGRAHV